MVFPRQKSRAGANTQYSPRAQPENNICEVRTTIWTVSTQEQNELFGQHVVQYCQEKEGEYLHYHVLCLNASSTEVDEKKAYRNPACRFHPDKNKHLRASDVMLMINEAKE